MGIKVSAKNVSTFDSLIGAAHVGMISGSDVIVCGSSNKKFVYLLS